MQLHGPSMSAYEVTEDDVLWLLRAVEAEGPVETEVAATLLNGFCFVRSRGDSRSLTDFVRAYAQPINPRWYLTGDLFVKSLKGRGEEEQRQAKQTAVRRETYHSTRTSFTPHVEKAVVAALHGLVAIPKNATDYAYPLLDATTKNYTALQTAVPGKNRLWARSNALNWVGYSVDPLVVKPWLASLTNVRLEQAFDREFTTELSKVAQFFADNAVGYTNQRRHITLGNIRMDIGEAADYSTTYSVSLVQRATNSRITSFERAQKMVYKSRAEFFKDGEASNQATSDAWARMAANLRKVSTTSSAYPTVINAVGFDFTSGTWTVTNGQKV